MLGRAKDLAAYALAAALVSPGCVLAVGNTADVKEWGFDGLGSLESGPALVGDGVAASATRAVEPFEAVAAVGSIDVVVRVGPERAVTVAGDANLVSHVETYVEGGTLRVGWDRGRHRPERRMLVTVSAPQVAGLSLSGSGDVSATGVDAPKLDVSLSGSGQIEVAGRVDALTATISGSGDLQLQELVAASAVVRISGSGDAHVHATQRLDAHVSGSGDVRYRGAAQVDARVSGSGAVTSER